MPIVNLTDKVDLSQGLPLLARLYKGGEQQDKVSAKGKKYKVFGEDLDHFRVVFEPQFEYLQPLWEGMYGPKPAYFESVLLCAPTVNTAFATWKEEWTATTMLHRCDGEKQETHYDKLIGKYSHSYKACAAEAEHPCSCVNIGRLNIMIMDFLDASNILGTFLVTTHSINDILTVYRRLAATESLFGTLSNVPFVFGRADKEIRAPKTDKDGNPDGRRTTTKSLFWIHVHPDFTGEKIIPALKAGNAWFKESSQQMIVNGGSAVNLLNSGKANGERRLGATPQVATPISRIEDIPVSDIPVHPDPTPLTRLSDTLKASGITLEVAARMLTITDTEDMEEWRKHGKTPNEITEKVQELQAKDKPNPFAKTEPEIKTVTGTVVDESQQPFDALPGEKDKAVVQPTLDGLSSVAEPG